MASALASASVPLIVSMCAKVSIEPGLLKDIAMQEMDWQLTWQNIYPLALLKFSLASQRR
jgi:hypothetical protein